MKIFQDGLLVKGNLFIINFYQLCKFNCFCFHRKTIKTKENVEVISKLIKEVRALNPTFSGSDIRGL